jgi:PHD/YefM family antitoxin component YafN of YafNO toxin-antitoxin module
MACSIHTVSSREFTRDVAAAKRATRTGPVFITDRNKPSYVLLSVEEYRRLTGRRQPITDLLAMPAEAADIDLPIRTSKDVARGADLS